MNLELLRHNTKNQIFSVEWDGWDRFFYISSYNSEDYVRETSPYRMLAHVERLNEKYRHKKRLFIKDHTRNRIREVTGIILTHTIVADKDFGTTYEDRLSNTSKGNFFIGNIKNQIKLGKILRSIFPDMPDYVIEAAVTKWKKAYENRDTEVVETYDVGAAYNISKCGGSCMSYRPMDWFEIYEDIGSRVAYLEYEGKLLARALIHELYDSCGNIVVAYDRIFFDREIDKIALEKYLQKRYVSLVDCGCELHSRPIKDEYRNVPYIDNIKYAINYDGETVLANFDDDYIDICQETNGSSCDGQLARGGRVYCEDTERYEDEYDVYYVENIDAYYRYDDDLIYIEGMGHYTQDCDDIVYAEDVSEYVMVDDAYKCETDGKWYSCLDQLVDVDGLYYRLDDDDIVYAEDVEEYKLYSECVYIEDIEEHWYYYEGKAFEHSDGMYYSYEENEDEEEIA